MSGRPSRNHADALRATLDARSVALVGASPRPGSLGQRMVDEVLRSPGFEQVWLVNPAYDEVAGRTCLATCSSARRRTRPGAARRG